MAERFGARRTLTRIVIAWSLFTALSGSAGGSSPADVPFLFGVGEAGAYPGTPVFNRNGSDNVQPRERILVVDRALGAARSRRSCSAWPSAP